MMETRKHTPNPSAPHSVIYHCCTYHHCCVTTIIPFSIFALPSVLVKIGLSQMY